MKFDLKRLGHIEEWRGVTTTLGRSLVRLTRSVLIAHSHLADLIAVALVLIAALYLVVILLYVAPPGVQVPEPETLQLNMTLTDRLVEWAQERAKARAEDFNLSSDTIFP